MAHVGSTQIGSAKASSSGRSGAKSAKSASQVASNQASGGGRGDYFGDEIQQQSAAYILSQQLKQTRSVAGQEITMLAVGGEQPRPAEAEIQAAVAQMVGVDGTLNREGVSATSIVPLTAIREAAAKEIDVEAMRTAGEGQPGLDAILRETLDQHMTIMSGNLGNETHDILVGFAKEFQDKVKTKATDKERKQVLKATNVYEMCAQEIKGLIQENRHRPVIHRNLSFVLSQVLEQKEKTQNLGREIGRTKAKLEKATEQLEKSPQNAVYQGKVAAIEKTLSELKEQQKEAAKWQTAHTALFASGRGEAPAGILKQGNYNPAFQVLDAVERGMRDAIDQAEAIEPKELQKHYDTLIGALHREQKNHKHNPFVCDALKDTVRMAEDVQRGWQDSQLLPVDNQQVTEALTKFMKLLEQRDEPEIEQKLAAAKLDLGNAFQKQGVQAFRVMAQNMEDLLLAENAKLETEDGQALRGSDGKFTSVEGKPTSFSKPLGDISAVEVLGEYKARFAGAALQNLTEITQYQKRQLTAGDKMNSERSIQVAATMVMEARGGEIEIPAGGGQTVTLDKDYLAYICGRASVQTLWEHHAREEANRSGEAQPYISIDDNGQKRMDTQMLPSEDAEFIRLKEGIALSGTLQQAVLTEVDIPSLPKSSSLAKGVRAFLAHGDMPDAPGANVSTVDTDKNATLLGILKRPESSGLRDIVQTAPPDHPLTVAMRQLYQISSKPSYSLNDREHRTVQRLWREVAGAAENPDTYYRAEATYKKASFFNKVAEAADLVADDALKEDVYKKIGAAVLLLPRDQLEVNGQEFRQTALALTELIYREIQQAEPGTVQADPREFVEKLQANMEVRLVQTAERLAKEATLDAAVETAMESVEEVAVEQLTREFIQEKYAPQIEAMQGDVQEKFGGFQGEALKTLVAMGMFESVEQIHEMPAEDKLYLYQALIDNIRPWEKYPGPRLYDPKTYDVTSPNKPAPLTQRNNDENSRVGFAVVFSTPKKLANLMIVSEGEEAKELSDVQNLAVERTMKMMEAMAYRREREGGLDTDVRTGSLLYTLWQHSTSNAGDPAPHVHAMIHLTADQEKLWKSQNGMIAKNMPFFQELYTQVLGTELVKLGYELEENGKTWDLKGFGEETKQATSRRQEQIQEYMKVHEVSTEEATKYTRQEKDLPGLTELRQITLERVDLPYIKEERAVVRAERQLRQMQDGLDPDMNYSDTELPGIVTAVGDALTELSAVKVALVEKRVEHLTSEIARLKQEHESGKFNHQQEVQKLAKALKAEKENLETQKDASAELSGALAGIDARDLPEFVLEQMTANKVSTMAKAAEPTQPDIRKAIHLAVRNLTEMKLYCGEYDLIGETMRICRMVDAGAVVNELDKMKRDPDSPIVMRQKRDFRGPIYDGVQCFDRERYDMMQETLQMVEQLQDQSKTENHFHVTNPKGYTLEPQQMVLTNDQKLAAREMQKWQGAERIPAEQWKAFGALLADAGKAATAMEAIATSMEAGNLTAIKDCPELAMLRGAGLSTKQWQTVGTVLSATQEISTVMPEGMPAPQVGIQVAMGFKKQTGLDKEKLLRGELNENQQDVLEYLLKGDQCVRVVQGWAGTGKTFTFADYLRLMKEQDVVERAEEPDKMPRKLFAFAKTHRAVDELKESLGAVVDVDDPSLEFRTVDGFLTKLHYYPKGALEEFRQEMVDVLPNFTADTPLKVEHLEALKAHRNQEGQPGKDYNQRINAAIFFESMRGQEILVDEMSQLSIEQTHTLVNFCKDYGARITFAGDTGQARSLRGDRAVEDLLTRVVAPVTLSDVMRQSGQNKEISMKLAQWQTNPEIFAEALDEMYAAGMIVEVPSEEEMIRHAAEQAAENGTPAIINNNEMGREVAAMTEDILRERSEAIQQEVVSLLTQGEPGPAILDVMAEHHLPTSRLMDTMADLAKQAKLEMDRGKSFEETVLWRPVNDALRVAGFRSGEEATVTRRSNLYLNESDKRHAHTFQEGMIIVPNRSVKGGFTNGHSYEVASIDRHTGTVFVKNDQDKLTPFPLEVPRVVDGKEDLTYKHSKHFDVYSENKVLKDDAGKVTLLPEKDEIKLYENTQIRIRKGTAQKGCLASGSRVDTNAEYAVHQVVEATQEMIEKGSLRCEVGDQLIYLADPKTGKPSSIVLNASNYHDFDLGNYNTTMGVQGATLKGNVLVVEPSNQVDVYVGFSRVSGENDVKIAVHDFEQWKRQVMQTDYGDTVGEAQIVPIQSHEKRAKLVKSLFRREEMPLEKLEDQLLGRVEVQADPIRGEGATKEVYQPGLYDRLAGYKDPVTGDATPGMVDRLRDRILERETVMTRELQRNERQYGLTPEEAKQRDVRLQDLQREIDGLYEVHDAEQKLMLDIEKGLADRYAKEAEPHIEHSDRPRQRANALADIVEKVTGERPTRKPVTGLTVVGDVVPGMEPAEVAKRGSLMDRVKLQAEKAFKWMDDRTNMLAERAEKSPEQTEEVLVKQNDPVYAAAQQAVYHRQEGSYRVAGEDGAEPTGHMNLKDHLVDFAKELGARIRQLRGEPDVRAMAAQQMQRDREGHKRNQEGRLVF